MSSDPLDTPPKRRRRGLARRIALLEATLLILGRDGSAAVTHRAVADEAGVPIAATTYYFSSKEDLLREALHLHAEREARRVALATQALGDTPTVDQLADQLADFVDSGLREGRLGLIAEYELLLQAARHPELEPLSRVFYDQIQDQLNQILKKLGAPDPERAARLIMATLAGMEVDNLATPTTQLPRYELRRLIGRLLHSLVEAESPDL